MGSQCLLADMSPLASSLASCRHRESVFKECIPSNRRDRRTGQLPPGCLPGLQRGEIFVIVERAPSPTVLIPCRLLL